ncbi:MAG: endolytic transglycosylase MltG [Gammaproteobacteria bacterium]|nr:endolytic transglycosylase MltG [Gammaproteobacteria bacterium]
MSRIGAMSRRSQSMLVAITLIVALGAYSAWKLVYAWADRSGPLLEPVVIQVEPGTGFGQLARELERLRVVSSAALFSALARFENAAESVRAGEYRFGTYVDPNTVLRQLVDGDVVVYRLRIVEGWSVSDLLAAVGKAPAVETTLAAAQVSELLARLGLGSGHAEGQFFPDTYHYVQGATDAEILRRAYRKMQSVIESEWNERARDLPYSNQSEALVMASLIEKETGVASDRARVAGVFVRRLKQQMKLQADPSVIYGLGTDFDGNLTRAHLDRDTPYNTYTRKGLPPTPIALPGRAAIHAALHPAQEEVMYFVARGDGSTEFSTTLAEHREAVRRFQLGEVP